jgi:prolipoprotein diacylglyceryltransferase
MSFKLFLFTYAVFRFSVEFVRGNPDMGLGLSGSQIFLLLTVPLLTWHVARALPKRREIAISGTSA